jgi:hypothetical protein
MREGQRVIFHGRRDWWLTVAVVALLIGEEIRTRWRRGVAKVTAVRRPALPTTLRRGCDELTAEDKGRLAARAGRALREENQGGAGS